MRSEHQESSLAEILPGRWAIRASNLLHWLSGERLEPTVEITVNSTEPLVLGEQVEFATADGKDRVVRSRSVWTGDSFMTRALGIRWPSARRWSVSGASEDGNVIVVIHGTGKSAAAGIDVLVREGSNASEVRAMIAGDAEAFQLSLEDFASLSWFPVPSAP